jgi:prepilin-type N-terminal cleavage/methylation domain-containing protein
MHNRAKQKSRHGFSLLELLAVMSIMAMLTTLAVTSYFNAIRGMTRRSAVKHLANTLILARQRACMEGTRVSVMMFNEVSEYDAAGKAKVMPSYAVCKEIGRLSFVSGTELVDEFAPLDKMFGTAASTAGYLGRIRLYNLTQGKWSNVRPSVKLHALPRPSAYQNKNYLIPAYAFVVDEPAARSSAATWNVGDSYGIEASPINSLPRGFQFADLTDSINDSLCVTFQPDGSAVAGKNISISTVVPVGSGETVRRSSVRVDNTGSTQYDEKWN